MYPSQQQQKNKKRNKKYSENSLKQPAEIKWEIHEYRK